MAETLKRNSVGYEIDVELLEIVKKKMGLKQGSLYERDYEVEVIVREDAKHLRKQLQNRVISRQKSVVKNAKRKSKSPF